MNWKLPPEDKSKVWINKSLEMQILLACNWRCVACDAGSNFSSFDWVRKATMSLSQIQAFVSELYANNAYFGRIRLLGGEPTIHPKFFEIVDLLHKLVGDNIGALEVITNGSHPEKYNKVRDKAKIRVSGTEAKESSHVANMLHTPESLGYKGKICNAPWHCGISLNYYGYFPCSSGAGIARFEDWMKWQRLDLPIPKKPGNAVVEAWPDLQSLCNHCYHALKPEHKVRCGTSDMTKNMPGDHIKPKIDEWKNGKKANWKVYGQA